MKKNLVFLISVFNAFLYPIFAQLEVQSNGTVTLSVPQTDATAFSAFNTSTQYAYPNNATGVHGKANAILGFGYGGLFEGGLYGLKATAHHNSWVQYRYGVVGEASNASFSIGLQGKAYGNVNNYGVWAEATGANHLNGYGNFGIYAFAPTQNYSYAGYFDGNVHITGALTGTSDMRLKKNIRAYNNGLATVMQLKPVQYQFQNSAAATPNSSINLAEGDQIGLLAQDVEQILPQLVTQVPAPPSRKNDFKDNEKPVAVQASMIKSVNYIEIVPILIQAIQDQQAQINALKEEIAKLKKN